MTTTASTGQEEGPAMSSLCCPCSDLVSIECIYRALSSEERSRSLMDWLSGKKSTRCIDGNSKDCQVRKVNASFSVLNAIRAACRPHLEAASSHKTGKSPAKQNTEPASAKTKAKPSYEETFPSLSSTASSSSSSKPPAGNSSTANDSNNQAVKDKTENANNTKKKKRIRPVAALTPVGGASGVWGNIAKQKPIEPTNNHFLSSTTAATAKLNGNNTGVWSGRTLNLPSENGTRKQPIQSPTRQRNNPPLSNRNDIFPQFSKSNSSAHSDGGGAWGTYDKSQGQSAAIQQSRPNNNAMQQPPPTCTPNKEFQNYSPETPPLHTADSKDTSTQQSAKEIIALSNKVAASPRTKIKPADHDNINRFVDVYCTLIWSNLVPSTALEVHLLLRLLHISNNQESSSKTSTTTDNMEDVLVLAPIFPDASYCQSFAAKALSKLSILLKHFGLTFLQDLVKSPIFRNQLPDVTKELEQAIKDQMAATGGLLTPPDQGSIISGGSQTALLTLPFQHERDSRHNFKSRDDMQLYKNREESRDAFLYQLRAFLNVRGKMLDTVQAQKAIQKIRTSSRVVVDGIMSVNLPWFTQFFCELLLQVGLVPFEETDKELLDIAGKEKLQKLHKRFSSKVGGSSNKSSWKLATANGKQQANSSLSKIEQAQQHFPGHQEFFFIFIVSADSHKLNLHLRSQLIQRIKNGQANLKDHRLSMYFEKTLLDMQMLARFLGVLIFAPSWQEFDKCNGYDNMPDVVPPDGLNQLEADADARISLLTLTKEALDGGNLTSVIPWVTELLKMSSWDNTIHRRSKTYRQILRLLRYIQEQLSFHIYNREQADKTPSCAQLVLFCLESFFGETIGLARTVSLRESHHHNESLSADDDESALGVSRSGDVDNLLDDSPLLFSTAVLFSLNPHMEELLSLVGTLSRIDHIKSNRIPGVSRKLRPVIVSRDVTTASSKSEAEFVVAATSPLVSPAPAVDYEETKIFKPGSSSSFQSKLVDTFFHQHRELKEICEFAVHQILKKMSTSIPERFVKPALEEELQLECDDAVDRAVGGALAYLRSSLEEGIHQSLALFEPPETLFKVHELAVSLAAARGYETGAPHVRNLVINDLKPIQRSLFGDQAGTKETEQSARKKEDQQERAESENLVAQMTLASNALVVSIKSQLTNNGEIDRVLDNIRSFEVLLDKWSDSKQSKIPAEHFLRDYFESVTKLDFCSVSVLEFCTATATSGNVYSEKSWLLLVAFLKLGFKLSRHPRRGTSRVVKYLRNPNALQSLIQTGLEHGSSKYDTLAELLVDMLEDSFLSVEQLENALVCKMDETAEVLDLAKLCLAQLQRRETLVFEMPRLKSKVVSISEK